MTDKKSGDKSGKPNDFIDLGKQALDQTSHLLSKEAQQIGKVVGDTVNTGEKVGEKAENRLEEVANAAFKNVEKLHKDFDDHLTKGDLASWIKTSGDEFINHAANVIKHGTPEQTAEVAKLHVIHIDAHKQQIEAVNSKLEKHNAFLAKE